MNFSDSYIEAMDRFATYGTYGRPSYWNSASELKAYSRMLVFDVKSGENTLPVFALPILEDSFYPDVQREGFSDSLDTTVVIPLYTDPSVKVITGGEAILKSFGRGAATRLLEIHTPKGEVYYGNDGLILDKDFTPLVVVTTEVTIGQDVFDIGNTKYINFHPKVFTDDDSTLNKVLAKKGIAYYLSFSGRWYYKTYSVQIKDCSEYIMRPHTPDIEHVSAKDFNQVLRDNIDEVLTQVINDNWQNFQ